MGDKSTIEWTDSTPMIDRGGRRVRYYKRKDATRPGQQERRRRRALGQKWCRYCQDWLPLHLVLKNGLCRPHENEAYRQYYAGKGGPDIRAQAYARKRNLEALPTTAALYLIEQYEGRCIYCGQPATTWDHLIPVGKGGQTQPGNIVPACASCNSSKKDADLDEWLKPGQGTPDLVDAIALALEGMVL